jgi:hypothetical protein
MGLGTLSPGAKKGNPKVALKPVTFLDVATWPVGVQPGRRSTSGHGSPRRLARSDRGDLSDV